MRNHQKRSLPDIKSFCSFSPEKQHHVYLQCTGGGVELASGEFGFPDEIRYFSDSLELETIIKKSRAAEEGG